MWLRVTTRLKRLQKRIRVEHATIQYLVFELIRQAQAVPVVLVRSEVIGHCRLPDVLALTDILVLLLLQYLRRPTCCCPSAVAVLAHDREMPGAKKDPPATANARR